LIEIQYDHMKMLYIVCISPHCIVLLQSNRQKYVEAYQYIAKNREKFTMFWVTKNVLSKTTFPCNIDIRNTIEAL